MTSYHGIAAPTCPWLSKCACAGCQESRPPAPILCTYMGRQNGGRAIRFLRNKSTAMAPNVYLLLYPRPELQCVLQARPDLLERLFEALEEGACKLVHG